MTFLCFGRDRLVDRIEYGKFDVLEIMHNLIRVVSISQQVFDSNLPVDKTLSVFCTFLHGQHRVPLFNFS